MSTVDDLMALAYELRWCDTSGSVQAKDVVLRTALEAYGRAEYGRGRGEREQDAEPVAWRAPLARHLERGVMGLVPKREDL